jgi:hypothetical protein
MRWRLRAMQLETMRREQCDVGFEPHALQALKVGTARSSRVKSPASNHRKSITLNVHSS